MGFSTTVNSSRPEGQEKVAERGFFGDRLKAPLGSLHATDHLPGCEIIFFFPLDSNISFPARDDLTPEKPHSLDQPNVLVSVATETWGQLKFSFP
jgi:hypothetical protein